MYPAHELFARLLLWEREREIRELSRAGARRRTSTGNDAPLRSLHRATIAGLKSTISRLAHVSHRPAH